MSLLLVRDDAGLGWIRAGGLKATPRGDELALTS
jgi:hypothetical protein